MLRCKRNVKGLYRDCWRNIAISLIDPGGGVLSGVHQFLWRWTGQQMPVSRIANATSAENEIPFISLPLERAGVSGNAQPFAIRIDPGVGESSVMIERLTLV